MRSDRKYDIIIFGATGFTGKHTLEEIVKTVNAGQSESFTWAVAGRSNEKLDEVLKKMSDVTGKKYYEQSFCFSFAPSISNMMSLV